ncbi:MAG: hypothetical protein R2911_01285 [Caldilineaceae bacterium]
MKAERESLQSNLLPPPTGELLHRSYLLRLWRSNVNGEWRASLQSVQSGERHMFADIDSLLAFLVEQSQPQRRGNG